MDQHVRATTRLPVDVADWLKAKAKEQSRSMNGQLVEAVRTLMRKEKNERA
ncbi:MAG: Arc family DNA-binding protein [Halopseudomonas sp.]|uniref:Arc family DNA-binding protein n=1 Tax=Halopseudomonas sp. TaxID=2901191 RepID=UPI0030023281